MESLERFRDARVCEKLWDDVGKMSKSVEVGKAFDDASIMPVKAS